MKHFNKLLAFLIICYVNSVNAQAPIANIEVNASRTAKINQAILVIVNLETLEDGTAKATFKLPTGFEAMSSELGRAIFRSEGSTVKLLWPKVQKGKKYTTVFVLKALNKSCLGFKSVTGDLFFSNSNSHDKVIIPTLKIDIQK